MTLPLRSAKRFDCPRRKTKLSFIKGGLRRQIFFLIGFAVFASIAAAVGIVILVNEQSPWKEDIAALRSFFGTQFELVWDDKEKRDALADSAASSFGAGVSLVSVDGESLGKFGYTCATPALSIPVLRNGEPLGEVVACIGRNVRKKRVSAILALLSAGFILWLLAAYIAYRFGHPLVKLAEVTREIGEGKLSARARLDWHHPDEFGELAHAINEMAERIERQMVGQRELLAGVSHEIRTPLARLRVLSEILRDRDVDEKYLSQIELEVSEIDELTGQLLANSRLEFESLDETEIDCISLAHRNLTRVGLDAEHLNVSGTPRVVMGDATLVSRALVNIMENAKKHGGGLDELSVTFDDAGVRFCALDSGPGFLDEDLERAFESFFRGHGSGKGSSSLGLGLSLVKRIAEAHDGTAVARNREKGGAEVCFSLSD